MARQDVPDKPRRGAASPARRFGVCALAIAVALSSTDIARAQPRGPGMLRDAEIEALLKDYSAPIARVAGQGANAVRIVLVNDRSFNAFVADGRRIFVNIGTVVETKTPNQLIGVLAHETGHIAGGHLVRLRQQLANMQTASIIAMILGGAAMVAAARQRDPGAIGPGAIVAPQEILRRSLLSYQRAEEQAADRAAMQYLARTNQSGRGMIEVFQRFQQEIRFQAATIDPYLQSHPMPADRIANLEELAKASPLYAKQDPPELQRRHDLVRAKIIGFLDPPATVLRHYPQSDTSLPARYARAISAYKFGAPQQAVAQIDALIREQPNNAYFHELKGQALLETGRPRDAIAPLRRAVALARNPALMRIMLGHALVSTNDAGLRDEAIRELQRGLQTEPDTPDGYRFLALAYAAKGDLALADVASAQSAFAAGDYTTAKQLAARAKLRLPLGSPGWLKAEDILNHRVKPN